MYGSGAGQGDGSVCEAASEGGTLKHGEIRSLEIFMEMVIGDGVLVYRLLPGGFSGESDV